VAVNWAPGGCYLGRPTHGTRIRQSSCTRAAGDAQSRKEVRLNGQFVGRRRRPNDHALVPRRNIRANFVRSSYATNSSRNSLSRVYELTPPHALDSFLCMGARRKVSKGLSLFRPLVCHPPTPITFSTSTVCLISIFDSFRTKNGIRLLTYFPFQGSKCPFCLCNQANTFMNYV